MSIQLLMLSLFCGFSLGLSVWSVISLNREAREGAFDADELFTDAPVFKLILPYIQTLGVYFDKAKALNQYRKDIGQKLASAGKSDSITPGEFFATQILAGVAAGAAGGYFCFALEQGIELVLGFAFLGFALPLFSLNDMMKKRQKAVRRVLPYTLDLLTLAVEAGLEFTSALQTIASKLGANPLRPEIQRLIRDMSMGKNRSEALKDMSGRINLEELKSIVMALVQADELGSPLGPTLRIQSEQMRRKRFEQAEKAAMEAPVKMLFPLIAFIFPLVFIVVFGPIVITAYYQLG